MLRTVIRMLCVGCVVQGCAPFKPASAESAVQPQHALTPRGKSYDEACQYSHTPALQSQGSDQTRCTFHHHTAACALNHWLQKRDILINLLASMIARLRHSIGTSRGASARLRWRHAMAISAQTMLQMSQHSRCAAKSIQVRPSTPIRLAHTASKLSVTAMTHWKPRMKADTSVALQEEAASGTVLRLLTKEELSAPGAWEQIGL